MWVTDQIFDGLVELDVDLTIQLLVAQSYHVDESGMNWTFVLRDDVRFSSHPEVPGLESGRRVQASDVVYSLNRLRDPVVASSGAWILEALDEKAEGAGVYARGMDTVYFKLKQPFPPFLGLLTTAYANIVPREAVEHFGADFRSNPIGCGPFKLAWWVEDVACVLHRNPDHWETDMNGVSLPYLEAIHIEFVADMGAEFQGLLQGRYDFMSGLHPAYIEELLDENGQLRSSYSEVVRMEKIPFLKTDYIGLFVGSEPSKAEAPVWDSRFRQAISWAIDRESIARHLRRGSVIPTDRFVPPQLLGEAKVAAVKYDPVASRRVIDSCKSASSEPWIPLVLSTTSDYTDLCAALQFQWREVGLDVSIDVLSPSAHRDRVAQGDAAMFRKSWLADYADAENFLSLFASHNFAPAGPNYTHYASAAYDSLYREALLATEMADRDDIHRRMDGIITDELPLIPLFHDQVTHFVGRGIENWGISPVNRLDLRRVRKVPLSSSSLNP